MHARPVVDNVPLLRCTYTVLQCTIVCFNFQTHFYWGFPKISGVLNTDAMTTQTMCVIMYNCKTSNMSIVMNKQAEEVQLCLWVPLVYRSFLVLFKKAISVFVVFCFLSGKGPSNQATGCSVLTEFVCMERLTQKPWASSNSAARKPLFS